MKLICSKIDNFVLRKLRECFQFPFLLTDTFAMTTQKSLYSSK